MKSWNDQFEAFATGQQQLYDFWADASKKMMDTFNQKEEATTGEALLKEWYEKQKVFFENAMKIGDPKEAFAKAPEQFKQWAELQNEFSEKWLKVYQKNAQTMGFEPPKWNSNVKDWNGYMEQSTQWIQEGLKGKLPFNMKPHFESFTKAYGDLYKYWESFSKMMEVGLYHKEAVEKYFSYEAYKAFVNQFMGYTSSKSLSEMMDQTNAFFDKYIEQFAAMSPNIEGFTERWNKEAKKLAGSNPSPYFQFVVDLNEQMRQNLVPYYNVLGTTKEIEATKIARDIQFTYVAFLVKTAEMQTKIYQAGQFALPDILKTYYEAYQKTKTLPDYPTFFNRYIDTLESYITEVLQSDAYSTLQNEVAKSGLAVKSKVDQLVELSFMDLPFVMRSEANDIAQETTSLRKKIRALERKIAALEEAGEAKTPVKKTTTRRNTTQKATDK